MSIAPLARAGTLAVAGTVTDVAGQAVGTFARLLGAALGREQPATGAPDGSREPSAAATAADQTTRIQSLRDRTQSLRSQFIAQFRELLAEHGIHAGGVELGLDDFGNVRVVGPHPEAAAIDHALATETDLTESFHRLAVLTQALEAAEAGAAPGAMPLQGPAGPWGLPGDGSLQGFVLAIPADAAMPAFV